MATLRKRTYTPPAAACLVALFLAICFCMPADADALAPRDGYFRAESCYRSLKQDPAKMKYRHHWLACIRKFDAVYRADPDGAWAPAGLYMAATLYSELYKRSYLAADLKEAVDIFERIGKRFPDSAYRPKAEAALETLGRRSETTRRPKAPKKSPPKVESSGPSPKALYMEADACYQELKRNERHQKYRDKWMRCIAGFERVFRADPDGPWAAAGLYMSGKLYRGLHRHSYREADQREAVERFSRIVEGYRQSRYHSRARAEIAEIAGDEDAGSDGGDPVEALIASGSAATGEETTPAPALQVRSTDSENGRIAVTGLRHWSNPKYTRVVVDAAGETQFTHHLLKKDPSLGKPPRLFVDLAHAAMDKDLEKIVPIDDDLLSKVRAGQYNRETVRVVIDIKSFDRYKIFSLKNPFRIVVDVWGESAATAQSGPEAPSGSDRTIPANALSKQLALGVRRVVIDPGHGGRDYGAPGYLKGVHEKYVVMSIARRLEKLLRSELGLEVILTRTGDEYLTLEERTAFANTRNADLFISIHTNSHRDRRAYGIETYFLNLATDNEAIMVAATENATSEKNISDLQTILLDLMQNAKINESSRLATHVQKEICGNLDGRYSHIRDKGVKQAPFYVLLGAQMPAILVETSFISNARECKRLVKPEYQKALCRGIVRGIQAYIRENQPALVRDAGTTSWGG